jgi:hypothetical protein
LGQLHRPTDRTDCQRHYRTCSGWTVRGSWVNVCETSSLARHLCDKSDAFPIREMTTGCQVAMYLAALPSLCDNGGQNGPTTAKPLPCLPSHGRLHDELAQVLIVSMRFRGWQLLRLASRIQTYSHHGNADIPIQMAMLLLKAMASQAKDECMEDRQYLAFASSTPEHAQYWREDGKQRRTIREGIMHTTLRGSP